LKVRKSELHYLWKCALLEKQSYEAFERICSSQEVGTGKLGAYLRAYVLTAYKRSIEHLAEKREYGVILYL